MMYHCGSGGGGKWKDSTYISQEAGRVDTKGDSQIHLFSNSRWMLVSLIESEGLERRLIEGGGEEKHAVWEILIMRWLLDFLEQGSAGQMDKSVAQ